MASSLAIRFVGGHVLQTRAFYNTNYAESTASILSTPGKSPSSAHHITDSYGAKVFINRDNVEYVTVIDEPE